MSIPRVKGNAPVLSLLYFTLMTAMQKIIFQVSRNYRVKKGVLKFISQTTYRNINEESFSLGSDKRMSPLQSQFLQPFSSSHAPSP